MTRRATFTATLRQDPNGAATGIVVPSEVLASLDAGKRPPVRVTLGSYEYRTTLGVMAGRTMIPVSAAVRGEAGLMAGDDVEVVLVVDTSPREVDVPGDLAAAMASSGTRPFFDQLSNSLQRYHVDNVNGAKTDDTRARRVARAVELFRAGKQR